MDNQKIMAYSVNQPNNINAWRIGEACRRAAEDPKCGDYIDRGLILMRELEARGLGVVTLPANAVNSADAVGGPVE